MMRDPQDQPPEIPERADLATRALLVQLRRSLRAIDKAIDCWLTETAPGSPTGGPSAPEQARTAPRTSRRRNSR